jgi:hypothetical protein
VLHIKIQFIWLITGNCHANGKITNLRKNLKYIFNNLLSFLVGTISNVLVMEIGWTDVESGGYILVSCAHSNTTFIKTLLIVATKNPIFRHIKSNNSETVKVNIVKNERDPPLFTGKLLIKF